MTWVISDPVFESDPINKIFRLETSPWAGHRCFVYDLVNFVKPKSVLELGTHFGCSFFAFCQAVKDSNFKTSLTAIDNWKGDEHAGFYNEEVFDIVKKTKDTVFFKQNIHLIRNNFTDGLLEIRDGSIDIIHIDGFHTFEAVKKDFNESLPKLSKNGIMLFHDTDKQSGYTSAHFWDELKSQYLSFEFDHSWGLGILFPKGDKWFKALKEENFQDKILIYKYKALYQQDLFKLIDNIKLVEERMKIITEMDNMIKQRDKVIKKQKELIDEKDEGIKNQSTMIDERDQIIKKQKELIDEKDEGIKNQSTMINERDQIIKKQKELIDEKDEGIKNQSIMIDERDQIIESQKKLLEDKDEEVKRLTLAI